MTSKVSDFIVENIGARHSPHSDWYPGQGCQPEAPAASG